MVWNRIVLGVGNPGPDYEATRHNAGFMVLDHLASRLGLVARQGLSEALRSTYSGSWLGTAAILLVVAAVGFGNAAYEAGNFAGAALALSLVSEVGSAGWALVIGAVGKREPYLSPTAAFHPTLARWLGTSDYAGTVPLRGSHECDWRPLSPAFQLQRLRIHFGERGDHFQALVRSLDG